MDTNNSKSFVEEAQEFDEMSRDPKLHDIISRLNNRQNNEDMLLLHSKVGNEDSQNFKNYISKNYLKSQNQTPALKKHHINSDSARPLKNDESDEEEENKTENKVLLDPEEERKIEDHIKQFKVNSLQHYSIMKHYFLTWHEICEKRKEMENTKKKPNAITTSNNPSAFKNLTPNDEDNLTSKLKKEKMAVSPTKRMKEGIEPKSLDQKLLPAEKKKKMKNTNRVIKEGDVIHKISKNDILKFIPFCNDVVLPKKK